LKSVDRDLETPATKCWKYVSPLRTNNSTSIRLHVVGACIGDPGDVAEACAKHFYTTLVTSHHRLAPFLPSVLIPYH